MTDKVGRNDPCPCGSGKKYKACCWGKSQPLGKRKFKATLISGSKKSAEPTIAAFDEDLLLDRIYGNAIKTEKPFTTNSEQQDEVK